MTKQEIINDEIFFQRACDLWVERNIGQCVSSLMYNVGRNLEECSRIFDFDYDEVYEHWIVTSSWAAEDLRAYGQIVFEFGGMTIFGRCTTGQSLLLDGFVRRLMRDLPDDHWIWGAVK